MSDPFSILAQLLSLAWIERVGYAIALASIVDPFIPDVPSGIWWTPIRWMRVSLHFIAQNWDRLHAALVEARIARVTRP